MKTIAFYGNNLCLRGTTNAIYAYADYNEKILGNKSIICAQATGDLSSLNKFQNRFKDIYTDSFYSIIQTLVQKKVDYLYVIKAGDQSDGICTNEIPTLVHAVFCKNDPHGHKYCYVSDWLAADQGYSPDLYAVPHIVEKYPDSTFSYRELLGIGADKTVIGCYGGSTEFNISNVHTAIHDTCKVREDIIFLFMNINQFCEPNKNIIHLPGTWEIDKKAAFINACDAMIHARRGGETFGLAVAEFTIHNKPVITYKDSGERSHIEILKDRGIYYRDNYKEIYDIINNLKSYIKYDNYYKAYDNFSPEKIMNRFNTNFLQ